MAKQMYYEVISTGVIMKMNGEQIAIVDDDDIRSDIVDFLNKVDKVSELDIDATLAESKWMDENGLDLEGLKKLIEERDRLVEFVQEMKAMTNEVGLLKIKSTEFMEHYKKVDEMITTRKHIELPATKPEDLTLMIKTDA